MATEKAKQVVEVEVPEGMTAEQYKKLTATFLGARLLGKKRDKAIQNATKALKVKHQADWKALLKTELVKQGITVKS